MRKTYTSIILPLSLSDHKKLTEMSNESNMKVSEFLRTLIQITYIAHKGPDKKGHIEIGGYGLTFPPEILEEFSNRMAESFKDFDFESMADKITIKQSKRLYKSKETA